MPRNAPPLMADLNRGRGKLDLYGGAWPERCRIRVGPDPDAPKPVNACEAHFDQVEALAGHRQQVVAFDRECVTDGLLATIDHARLVLAAPGQQHGIQRVEIARSWHWDEVVAAKEPGFSFDATFFMALAGRTEARFKAPM